MASWVQLSKRKPTEDGWYFWQSFEHGVGGFELYTVSDQAFYNILDEDHDDNSYSVNSYSIREYDMYWLDETNIDFESDERDENGH